MKTLMDAWIWYESTRTDLVRMRRRKLFEKENPPRVKPLLYVYRVLLTGIHLMNTGIVEANLVRLNETAKLAYLDDLIQRKVAGAEKERLTEGNLGFHRSEYGRLRSKLQQANEASD